MKRIVSSIVVMTIGIIAVFSQTAERLYVQTDKDFYLSGENICINIYGTDENGRSLDFSKVAYVELQGDDYNAVRVKIALKKGRGYAKMELPFTLSSGIYELVAYTRWMRNEGEKVFFRKPLAVFNSLRYSNSMDQLEIVDSDDAYHVTTESSNENLKVWTDKSSYHVREKVCLSLDNLPEDADVSVSVVREDMYMPEVDWENYQKRSKISKEKNASEYLLPELEGMIAESRFVPLEEGASIMLPNLSVKGKEFHYYAGQNKPDGRVFFYIPMLEGVKEMVASVESRGRLEMISPFVATPPQRMQPLHLYKEQEAQLLERCMQVQTNRFYPNDSVQRKEFASLLREKPYWSYDLDEYRRFKTFEETFLEFMPGLTTIKKGNRRFIMLSEEITGIPNHGNTLVLLDGVSVMDHDLLLNYNPYFVKWVDVYVGQFVFGEQLYSGIVMMHTPNHWMPNFQLPENSVVVEYEGTLPTYTYNQPNWKNKSYPDFRHTLYWNPNVTSHDRELECWTSDLCGTYIVKVRGLSKDGKRIFGTTSFIVEDGQ